MVVLSRIIQIKVVASAGKAGAIKSYQFIFELNGAALHVINLLYVIIIYYWHYINDCISCSDDCLAMWIPPRRSPIGLAGDGTAAARCRRSTSKVSDGERGTATTVALQSPDV